MKARVNRLLAITWLSQIRSFFIHFLDFHCNLISDLAEFLIGCELEFKWQNGDIMEFTARDRLKLLGGASAFLLSACGGGSSSNSATTAGLGAGPTNPVTPAPTAPTTPTTPTPPPTGNNALTDGFLSDTFRNNFKMGTAMTANRVTAGDLSANLALAQFNSITPEYELKPDQIAPTEGVYNFVEADRIVNWAIDNGKEVRGHALVWHEATPSYFYEGSRNQIRARLETYISTVVEHFRDRIQIWDVVNEVTSVDLFNGNAGIGPDRRTPWFDAVGNADYIDWAFQAARAADPNAQLFLSDYETETPRKRDWMIDIVRRLRSRGIPIDGVGHQFHLGLNTDPNQALAAIDAVDNEFAGLINHVTELDVSFYTDPGSCWSSQTNCQADVGETAPDSMLASQATLLRALFDGLKLRSSVETVSLWGVRDGDSWLNLAPVPRNNHPLLFDRSGNPKPALRAITDANYVI